MSSTPLTPDPNADDGPGDATHHTPAPQPATPEPPPYSDTSSELSADALLHRETPAPRGGWRRALYTATRGHLNPGDSKPELRRRELEGTVRGAATPDNHQCIVVLGAQHRVGATSTALALGSVLAGQRGDRMIAVDANAGRASLADRLPLRSAAERELGTLLAAPNSVARYSDMRTYVAQSSSGLDVLASHTTGDILAPVDLRRIAAVVEHFYSLQIVDGGVVNDQPTLPILLQRATRVVLVTHPSHEGGNRAATALDEIRQLGHTNLAATALIALAGAKDDSHIDSLERQLTTRCHRALRIPEDRQAHRTTINPDQFRASAMLGYLELLAEIVSGFDEHGGRRSHDAGVH